MVVGCPLVGSGGSTAGPLVLRAEWRTNLPQGLPCHMIHPSKLWTLVNPKPRQSTCPNYKKVTD